MIEEIKPWKCKIQRMKNVEMKAKNRKKEKEKYCMVVVVGLFDQEKCKVRKRVLFVFRSYKIACNHHRLGWRGSFIWRDHQSAALVAWGPQRVPIGTPHNLQSYLLQVTLMGFL